MKWLKAFWVKLWAESQAQRPASSKSSPEPEPLAEKLDEPVVPLSAFRPKKTQEDLFNFTPRAQQALAFARKEAEKLNHNFLGTEHVLLGLIALGQGRAVFALREMGLQLDLIRAEIIRQVGTGPDQKIIGNIPYTPRVKKVFALAVKEARALQDTWVGTDHLLLGLLREGDGVAARVLMRLNVTVEKARAAVLEVRKAERGESQEMKETMRTSEEPEEPAWSEMVQGNLTPRALRVLVLARKEAEHLNVPFIGTEHVLLGLSLLGAGVATNVLDKIGLPLEVIQAGVEQLASRTPAPESSARAFHSPLVNETLSFAKEEAKALDHTYIGTEHLLLALLRQADGGAVDIFKNRDIDTAAVRKEIIKELSPVYIEHVPGKGGHASKEGAEGVAVEAPAGGVPIPIRPRRESIDLKLRYDVYCVERDGKMVVYRNAQFRSSRTLFLRHPYDGASDFVELEQRDGQTIFVAKASIVRFCQHGARPEPEDVG